MLKLSTTALFIGFATFSFAQDTIKKVSISGSVKIIHRWCTDVVGGKKYEEYIKPRPFRNKALYVKRGEINDFIEPVLLEFTSDSGGDFTFSLPPGKYFIVDERKKDRAVFDTTLARYGKGTTYCRPIDTACYWKWYQTPEVILNVVKDSIKNITLTFYTICSGDCDIPCARPWHYRR